jgi:hypothetical protein
MVGLRPPTCPASWPTGTKEQQAILAAFERGEFKSVRAAAQIGMNYRIGRRNS